MYPLFALTPLLLSSAVYATQTLCDVSNAVIDIPPGQTNLSLPSGIVPKFIAVGLGTQNYTCSSAGTYTYVLISLRFLKPFTVHLLLRNVGAFAELIDISCFVTNPGFASLRKRAPFPDSDAVWNHEAQVRAFLSSSIRLGFHFFQNVTIGGVSGLYPIWDFRGDLLKNDSQAFVAATKIGDLLSPDNSTQDVDWLELTGVQGELSSFVYRVDSHFGQPPKTVRFYPFRYSNLNQYI